ncbi:MAG: hypothetical protein JRH11_20940 [Deltaproteobacteria bacterium]|nr:hypothetical protein [Deltaproteobacteria bacterium]
MADAEIHEIDEGPDNNEITAAPVPAEEPEEAEEAEDDSPDSDATEESEEDAP